MAKANRRTGYYYHINLPGGGFIKLGYSERKHLTNEDEHVWYDEDELAKLVKKLSN